MQFQREYYSRHTSPDSISAYHATSGYLSHPHPGPKRSTAEDTFMSPTTGLGITHPYGFQLQQEHQSFYAARQEYPKFPSDVQRDFSSSERGPSPQQANPFSLPSYIHHSKHLSYYMTLGHARSPPHHSQSNLARTAGGNAWEPSTFYEHMMSPSIADDLESRHFRYQPDALQDGRWANASCEVSYTTSSEPSNITAWDSNGFHEHVYHDQYAVSDKASEYIWLHTNCSRFFLLQERLYPSMSHKQQPCRHRPHPRKANQRKIVTSTLQLFHVVLREGQRSRVLNSTQQVRLLQPRSLHRQVEAGPDHKKGLASDPRVDYPKLQLYSHRCAVVSVPKLSPDNLG